MAWSILAIFVTIIAVIIPLFIFLVRKLASNSSASIPTVAPDDQSTTVACLGRSFKVGMLYNSYNDSPLTNTVLWNDDLLQKATTSSQEEEVAVDFEVISDDTLSTKVHQLGIETDLSLSVVSESIEVSKSAEYLHDVKTSSRQVRVVLKCQRFTKSDKLIMKKPDKYNVDPSILRDGKATHVVVGVKYGSGAFFVFDREVPEDEDYDSACREMKLLIKRIPNMAKGKESPSKEDDFIAGKLQFKFHSDQPITQTLSTFNDVVNIYKRFLTDTRTEVPKVAWLYPLHLLDKEAPTVHPIEHQLIMKTLNVLDSFHILIGATTSLSKHGVCKYFPGIRQQLEQCKTLLQQQHDMFKRELSSLLPEIRKTESDEELKTLIETSLQQKNTYEQCFNEKKKEIKVLSQLLRKLEGVTVEIISSQRQFNNFKKRHGGSNRIISLEFQVSQETTMLLNETAWYDNTDLTSKMTEKINEFVRFGKSSLNCEMTKFVVITLSNNTSSVKGIGTYLYKPGNPNPEEFDFSLQANNDDILASPNESDDNNDDDTTEPAPLNVADEERLAIRISDDELLSEKITAVSTDNDPFIMYKLKTKVVLNDANKNIAKATFGTPNTLTPTKMIMVMGATGAGKSTLINGMVNYVLGVKFEDEFRFQLIYDETTKSQSHSQTDTITAYTLYWQEGFQVPYNLTIIDTPGFGDTRGIERDKKITTQVKELFSIRGDDGIDQIHAIGFVTQSALARLTPTQRYIFDSILSIFGKDIEKNIFVMATFADSSKPPVLDALKEANLPYSNLFSFNNSALFTSSKEGHFSKPFWDMGVSSFQTFFSKLYQLEPASLFLTREVLKEREKLETVLNSVQPKMTEGLSKMETLRQEETMLRGKDSQVMGNKDFTYQVDVTKQKKVELPKGMFVTNCLICNFSCHKPCGISNDGDKYRCAAMDTHDPNTAKCKACPQKCGWRDHHNNPYYFELYVEKETRTSQDLLSRYNIASTDKLDVEAIIRNLHEDLDGLSRNVVSDIRTARRCIERLSEIALKPNPMTEEEYIELLIQSENEERKPGYQERIKSYENMKKNAQKMTDMTDEELQESLEEDKEEKGPANKKKWWQFWAYNS